MFTTCETLIWKEKKVLLEERQKAGDLGDLPIIEQLIMLAPLVLRDTSSDEQERKVTTAKGGRQ